MKRYVSFAAAAIIAPAILASSARAAEFHVAISGSDKNSGDKAGPVAPVETASRPNIVVILGDDMGVGDVHALQPKHCKIPTPNLDRLAQEGMTFTDAHSGAAVCSPTRYGLLTGRYAWRTRLRTLVLWAYDPPLIAEDTLTVPALLKQQGYTTAAIGKWHLGANWPFVSAEKGKQLEGMAAEGKGKPEDFDWSKPITGGPVERGFDYYFGTFVPNQPPYCFIENRHPVGIPSNMWTGKSFVSLPGPMLPGWKFDEILPTITQKVVSYIGDRAMDKKPFFLYFAMTSPHEPIAPSKDWLGKSGINHVADYIMETDGMVGEVLNAISKNGLASNTLVIFTADNGANVLEIASMLKHGYLRSGPYRGYKQQIWEGGHHVPFIARWPGKIKAASKCDDVVCLTDIMATSAAITGAKLPPDAGVDSVNILPDLLGTATAPLREATVHQGCNGGLSIRQGKWKLICCPGGNQIFDSAGLSQPSDAKARKQGLPSVQLYDVSQDIAERMNVEAEHPDVVKRLTALLQKYIDNGRSTPGPKEKNDVPVKLFLKNAPNAHGE